MIALPADVDTVGVPARANARHGERRQVSTPRPRRSTSPADPLPRRRRRPNSRTGSCALRGGAVSASLATARRLGQRPGSPWRGHGADASARPHPPRRRETRPAPLRADRAATWKPPAGARCSLVDVSTVARRAVAGGACPTLAPALCAAAGVRAASTSSAATVAHGGPGEGLRRPLRVPSMTHRFRCGGARASGPQP